MRLGKTWFALCTAAACASHAATMLDVTNAAALGGAYGLEVIFDGSTGAAYLQDDSPTDESHLVAEFRIRVEGAGFQIAVADDETSRHEIYVGRSPSNLFRVEVHCRVAPGGPGSGNCGANDDGQWRAKSYVRRDDDTWRFCGQTGFVPTGSALFGLEWGRGTGGSDGYLRFFKGGSLVGECLNVDNDDRGVNAQRLGATGRVDAGTSGSSYMDSFVSTR